MPNISLSFAADPRGERYANFDAYFGNDDAKLAICVRSPVLEPNSFDPEQDSLEADWISPARRRIKSCQRLDESLQAS